MRKATIKDSYNVAKTQTLSEQEIYSLLEETWDLLKGLESNEKYYQTCVDVKELRNELALVQAKIDLMTELNEDPDAVKIDLMSRFRRINRDFEEQNLNLIKNDKKALFSLIPLHLWMIRKDKKRLEMM